MTPAAESVVDPMAGELTIGCADSTHLPPVTVEHVHVHAGGQAVVGVVAPPGGGDQSKSEDQPHAKQIAHAPQLAMRKELGLQAGKRRV